MRTWQAVTALREHLLVAVSIVAILIPEQGLIVRISAQSQVMMKATWTVVVTVIKAVLLVVLKNVYLLSHVLILTCLYSDFRVAPIIGS